MIHDIGIVGWYCAVVAGILLQVRLFATRRGRKEFRRANREFVHNWRVTVPLYLGVILLAFIAVKLDIRISLETIQVVGGWMFWACFPVYGIGYLIRRKRQHD